MEINTEAVTTFINNVGFPIAVCGCLMWYIVKIESKQSEALTKLTDAVNRLLDLLDKRG